MSDTFGRTHTVSFAAATADGKTVNVVSSIELATFDGTTATYTFDYDQISIPPPQADTYHANTALLSVPVLTGVALPDGSSFVPDYYPAGQLKSLTLPTLGRIEYAYGNRHFPTEGCDEGQTILWAQSSEGVSRRTFFDADGTDLGSYTYSQLLLNTHSQATGFCTGESYDPAEVSRMEIRTPNGDLSYHYFGVWPNLIPQGGSPNGFRVHEYGLPYDLTQPDATGTRFLSSEIFGLLGHHLHVEAKRLRTLRVR